MHPLLKVSGVVLMVSMIPAMLQPSAHAEDKERLVKHPTSYRTIQVDGLSIFYREAGRKTRQRFCCCTGFPPRRGCSSPCSLGFPIAITC